jgi:L-ascorbate metabolism protein UlaG (beta-lactamase superfamily)
VTGRRGRTSDTVTVRFRRDVAMNVAYADRTPFGSPVGDGPDLMVRRVFAPIVEHVERHGLQLRDFAAPGPLLDAVRAGELFGAVTRPDADGAWRVRDEVLYPDASRARPRVLTVANDHDGVTRAQLPAGHWPAVHDLTAHLSDRGLSAGERAALHPDLAAMTDAFAEQGLLEEHPADACPPSSSVASELDGCDLTFVGHNTVVVRAGGTRLLIDPFLPAATAAYPPGYQPLQAPDLGALDAVLVTHSHRDHFDAASLLRLPRTTPVVVPAVPRETMLTVDMARRLGELGCTDVRTVEWRQALRLGPIEVVALPFFGEQPTDGGWLHPEVRNHGCTYLVRTPDWSAVFLADSAADHAGSVRALAAECRRDLGPVDVVFCGYRSWFTYPPQLLFSSVARYFLLIPPDRWPVRQRLMSSIDDALDVAEAWGARYLCPYAAGGAPWHWRLDLGPRLDGGAAENAAFDPFPERVAEAASARSQFLDGSAIGSPVEILLLRPGDSVAGLARGGRAQCHRVAGHAWPYDERT